MSTTTHVTDKTDMPDLQALFPWSDNTMQIAERAYHGWLLRAETVTHAMEFWNTEFQKGLDAMSQMAQCQTAAEAFDVQTRYATEAVHDLFAEGQKVIEQLAALSPAPWGVQAPAAEAAESAHESTTATGRRSSRRRS